MQHRLEGGLLELLRREGGSVALLDIHLELFRLGDLLLELDLLLGRQLLFLPDLPGPAAALLLPLLLATP